MFILDTNVVSEVMRELPNSQVLKWVDSQPISEIFATAITEAEILAGIASMPEGRRRRNLLTAANRIFTSLISGRILPFDRGAASAYADIMSSRRLAGAPISQFDCQIAAIARSVGSSVATRNVKDFTGCGVEVINPWTANSDL